MTSLPRVRFASVALPIPNRVSSMPSHNGAPSESHSRGRPLPPAVYGRALSADEVEQNFVAGFRSRRARLGGEIPWRSFQTVLS